MLQAHRVRLLAGPFFCATSVVVGAAQDANPRPKFSLLRQNEDWSQIEALDESEATFSDRLKWMALDDAGRWRLSVGGASQWRVEGWNTFGLDDSIGQRTDDVFLLGRVRLHADLSHEGGFRAFAEIKSAAAWDRDLPGGDRPIDEDDFALLQGFLEHRFDVGPDSELTVRAGRHMLQYGRQRLVSPLPWGNTLRAWDGAIARLNTGPWAIDALWARFAPVNSSSFNDSIDDELFGVFAQRRGEGDDVDVYAFGRDRNAVNFNGTTGGERRVTIGGRRGRAPTPGQMDYDVEVALQRGEVGSDDIDAWMLGAEVGYRFEGGSKPRIRAGVEMGSGDDQSGGEAGTFSAPFPLGHAYYGYLDAVGRENSIDVFIAGTWFATPTVRADLALHKFFREDDGDFVYRVNGAPYLGTNGASDSSGIGSELDLVFSGRVGRSWAWQVGWAHFLPDSALEAAGFDDDSDLIYTQLTYAF